MRRTKVKKHKRKIGRRRVTVKAHKRKVKRKKITKSMAVFTNKQMSEISKLNLNTNDYINEGVFGKVYGLNKDYILKTEKTEGDNKKEQYKYEKVKDNPLIIPSLYTQKGLVRPRLNIKTRGAIKKDWSDPSINKSGYLVFEDKNLTDNQAKKIILGVNKLSESGVAIGDDLQIGVDKKGEPYLYDLGEMYETKEARDSNDIYKERFLKGFGKSHLFDRDYNKEAEEAANELNMTWKDHKLVKRMAQQKR